MRLLLTVLLGFMLAVPAAVRAGAQEFVATPVEISADKVNVKGSVYYLHKVLKGHTLYSISKAYGVDIETIKAANPSLSEGLKAGMLLYIPEKPSGTAEATAAAPAVQPRRDTVQTTADERGERTAPQGKTKAAKQKKYKKYNIKWYETLDDVAVKFNVTTEAIIALNGIDPDSGKRIRSVLIPDSAYMQEFRERAPQAGTGNAGTVQEENAVLPDKRTSVTDESVHADAQAWEWDVTPDLSGTDRCITLILPFNASRLTGSLNAYTADFYAGAMIAAADLKEKGLFSNFHLNIIDINRYGSAWELVADNALNGSGLIIGPISERDMQPIASWARSKRIPVVSPLDLKTASLLQDNPYLYLFPPQSDLALDHQLDKIAEASHSSDTTESVTVIYEQGYERSDIVSQTMSGLAERGIPFKTFKYDFLSGRGIDSLMSQSLDSVLVNRVIIPSMSEAFITDALRNLSLIQSSRGYSIDVYGMSRWKSFETVELDYFHALDLRLAMSYHIDYNSPEVISFIDKYRAAFNTEPTSFAFQGYDIMTFFVEAMNALGRDFPDGIAGVRRSLLQSDVMFEQTEPGSGYLNTAFKDICFTSGWRILNE